MKTALPGWLPDAGTELEAVIREARRRQRRRWLAAKEKCSTGALGDVTLVTSRAFMNRLVAIDNYKRTDDPSTISPMVISGTHALDICMWCLAPKKAVECYARSIDKVLGPSYNGIDATAGIQRRHKRPSAVTLSKTTATAALVNNALASGDSRAAAMLRGPQRPQQAEPEAEREP